MKSNLFTKNDYLGIDDFREDVNQLLSLPPNVQILVARGVVDCLPTATVGEEKRFIEQYCDANEIDEYDFRTSKKIITTFAAEFSEDRDGAEDSIEDIVQDALDNELIDESKKEQFSNVLQEIRNSTLTSYSEVRRRRLAVNRAIPLYDGIFYSVNLRAIVANEWELHTDIKDYEPEVSGLTPVVNLEVRISNHGDKEHVYFQITDHHLDIMIGELQAAKKEIEAIVEYSGLEKTEGD